MTENTPVIHYAEAVAAARAKKEEIELQLREANNEVRAAEAKLLEAMTQHGLDSVTCNGLRMTKIERLTVKRTDPDALMAWLQDSDWADCVQPAIHHRTLEKVVRESLSEDGVLPPGVDVDTFNLVQVRKA